MREIILIGGNGFIGRHLASMLADQNYGVTVLGRNSLPVAKQLKNVRYLIGDYRDEATLASVLTKNQVVIHLAHEAIKVTGGFDIAQEVQANVMPAEGLFRACLEHNIKKIILVSSGGTVYGDPNIRSPLNENSPANPISLYGTSKLFIERVALLSNHQDGLPVSIVRPANAYGPGQLPFTGQGIIATAFGSAYLNKDITMFGNGETIRDYVHVDDVARSIMMLMESGRSGETYNIGTGVGTSIRELLLDHIGPVAERDGYKLRILKHQARGVDVSYNVLDTSKISQLMKTPPISLSQGIEESWAWIKGELK